MGHDLTIGGPGANRIDLSDVLPSDFPALNSVTVDGGGGNDTLIAPARVNVWSLTGEEAGTIDGLIGGDLDVFSRSKHDAYCDTTGGEGGAGDHCRRAGHHQSHRPGR